MTVMNIGDALKACESGRDITRVNDTSFYVRYHKEKDIFIKHKIAGIDEEFIPSLYDLNSEWTYFSSINILDKIMEKVDLILSKLDNKDNLPIPVGKPV